MYTVSEIEYKILTYLNQLTEPIELNELAKKIDEHPSKVYAACVHLAQPCKQGDNNER